MPYAKTLLLAFSSIVLLSGCGSFASHRIPQAQAAQNKVLSEKTKVYVRETVKAQDSGKICVRDNGCLWHGTDTIGEIVADELVLKGASGVLVNGGVSKGKKDLKENEYWVDCRIRHKSDGAGKWFLKSLVGGLSFTLLPIWQEVSADVDVVVTDHNQKVLLTRNYSDSYTGIVWLFLFPAVSTASAVPDGIMENIGRTAVNDLVGAGVFARKD